MSRVLHNVCFCAVFVLLSNVICEIPDPSMVTQILQDSFNCQKRPKSAMVVSVVKDGNVVYSNGFGSTTFGGPADVDADTLIGIASCTKAFTSMLAVKLLDKYELNGRRRSVDSRLQWVFKKDIFGRDHWKQTLLSDYATVRDFIAHRIGQAKHNYIRLDESLTRDNLIDRLKHFNVIGRYRDSFYYTNLNYGMLTHLAEELGPKGNSWEDLVQSEIFNPLGMTSSTFATTMQPNLKRAKGYWDIYGNMHAIPMNFTRKWGLLSGSGAIMSTANDMAKWMKFQLNDGKDQNGNTVLKADLLEMTHGQELPISRGVSKWFERPENEYSYHIHSYAMGWTLGTYRGRNIISHTGTGTGVAAITVLYPKEKFGIFVSMTGPDYREIYRTNIQNVLADLFLDGETCLTAEKICNFPGTYSSPSEPDVNKGASLNRDIQEYIGVYSNPAYGALEVLPTTTGEAKLRLKYGYAEFELYAKTGDEFYINSVGLTTGLIKYGKILFAEIDGEIKEIINTAFEKNDPPVFVKM